MSQRNFPLEDVLPAWDFAEVHSLVVPDLPPEAIAPHIDATLRSPDRWFDLAIALIELPGRLVRRLGGCHQASEKSDGIPA
ncbi:MAG: hypothetical protein EP306_13005 [Burkholderiales bacterium]|nr:MAG: hypothetical protein EP306_13005 [Burkholderiales bacterium]